MRILPYFANILFHNIAHKTTNARALCVCHGCISQQNETNKTNCFFYLFALGWIILCLTYQNEQPMELPNNRTKSEQHQKKLLARELKTQFHWSSTYNFVVTKSADKKLCFIYFCIKAALRYQYIIFCSKRRNLHNLSWTIFFSSKTNFNLHMCILSLSQSGLARTHLALIAQCGKKQKEWFLVFTGKK